jgi:hypothetical protein
VARIETAGLTEGLKEAVEEKFAVVPDRKVSLPERAKNFTV